MRRATIAVVDIDTPSPIANTSASIDSVMPTVATAFAPSLPTQNTSVTANSDSSTISSTIGMARSKMARFKFPVVKSWCEPFNASRTEDQKPRSLPSFGCGVINSRTDIAISPRRRAEMDMRANSEGVTLPSICDLQNHPGAEFNLGGAAMKRQSSFGIRNCSVQGKPEAMLSE